MQNCPKPVEWRWSKKPDRRFGKGVDTWGRRRHYRNEERHRRHRASAGSVLISRRATQGHLQRWVKVNAPVDEGIADLILALSGFPYLRTVESCQGGANQPSWVCFTYGDSPPQTWQDTAAFVLGSLGPSLVQEVGDRVSVILRVTEYRAVIAELTVQPGAMPRTVKALRKLARRYQERPAVELSGPSQLRRCPPGISRASSAKRSARPPRS